MAGAQVVSYVNGGGTYTYTWRLSTLHRGGGSISLQHDSRRPWPAQVASGQMMQQTLELGVRQPASDEWLNWQLNKTYTCMRARAQI